MEDNDIQVLVVDDEEVMRHLLTDLLSDEGFNVRTVCNGAEAVDEVKQVYFDIIFCDVHMPVMNGAEAFKLIKEISPETAMVMMDSCPDGLVQQAIENGALCCIHKPFDIQDVREIVGRFAIS